LVVLYTAFLLRINSIAFQYSLFSINFISEYSYSQFMLRDISLAGSKWSEEQIYLIFGTAPVLLTALGIRLLFMLQRGIHWSWQRKLTWTWTAFVLVNTLPCSMVAGVLFYDGFGTAFHWMLGDYFSRAIIGLGVLLMLVGFSRFWRRLFLNACNSPAFLDDEYKQKIFLNTIFLKPWLYGFIVLLFFNIPFSSWYWPAFLLSLGMLPSVNQTLRYQTIFIANPGNTIFTSRYQVAGFIIAVLALFGAGMVRVGM
jgi:hypothetical protein